MKKIFLLFAFVLGSISSQAQIIKVYENDSLVNTYANRSDKSYKVVVSRFGDGKVHELVDLGLSVKWATCNIGAETPYEEGSKFAWGETSTKGTYNALTYEYCNCPENLSYCTNGNHYTKYNDTDKKTVLELTDDAASVNWGYVYRMPTQKEFQELLDSCNWTWDSTHKGYTVTSKKNSNSIFLPAWSNYITGYEGIYWSRDLKSSSIPYAYYLEIANSEHHSNVKTVGNFKRTEGYSIRPVAEP